MRDAHSIPLLNQLHPKVKDSFRSFIEECENVFDITIRIISAYRSMEEQQKIYDQGRTTPGPIVTKAVPGSSYHNWGLAIDAAPLLPSGEVDYNYNQSKWANIAAQYDISWGGNWSGFKDMDHWECKMGHNWRDLLDMYHKKDFIPGTDMLNL